MYTAHLGLIKICTPLVKYVLKHSFGPELYVPGAVYTICDFYLILSMVHKSQQFLSDCLFSSGPCGVMVRRRGRLRTAQPSACVRRT